MNEYEALNDEVTKAMLDNQPTVTLDKWTACKILMDLGVLMRFRKEIGLLDRRDELERKE